MLATKTFYPKGASRRVRSTPEVRPCLPFVIYLTYILGFSLCRVPSALKLHLLQLQCPYTSQFVISRVRSCSKRYPIRLSVKTQKIWPSVLTALGLDQRHALHSAKTQSTRTKGSSGTQKTKGLKPASRLFPHSPELGTVPGASSCPSDLHIL